MVTAESSRPMTPATVGGSSTASISAVLLHLILQNGNGAVDAFAIGNADGDNGVDKFTAVIGDRTDRAIRDDMHSAAEIAQLCGTQGDAFDRTRNALNGDDIPDGVMVLKEDEEASIISPAMLCAPKPMATEPAEAMTTRDSEETPAALK